MSIYDVCASCLYAFTELFQPLIYEKNANFMVYFQQFFEFGLVELHLGFFSAFLENFIVCFMVKYEMI